MFIVLYCIGTAAYLSKIYDNKFFFYNSLTTIPEWFVFAVIKYGRQKRNAFSQLVLHARFVRTLAAEAYLLLCNNDISPTPFFIAVFSCPLYHYIWISSVSALPHFRPSSFLSCFYFIISSLNLFISFRHLGPLSFYYLELNAEDNNLVTAGYVENAFYVEVTSFFLSVYLFAYLSVCLSQTWFMSSVHFCMEPWYLSRCSG